MITSLSHWTPFPWFIITGVVKGVGGCFCSGVYPENLSLNPPFRSASPIFNIRGCKGWLDELERVNITRRSWGGAGQRKEISASLGYVGWHLDVCGLLSFD